MTDRLSQILLQRGSLRHEQLREAQEQQVLWGGALDSALLGLNAITEVELLRALQDFSDAAVARPQDALAPADTQAIRAFPEQWAKKYLLAPLSLHLPTHVLSVLTPVPPDLALLKRLSELLDMEIDYRLAPEFRVYQRLEQIYHHIAPPHIAELIRRFGEVVDEPAAQAAPAPLSLDDALQHLANTHDRDSILRTVLRYAAGLLEYSALFVQKKEGVTGWAAVGNGRENIDHVRLDEQSFTPFRLVLESSAPFLGPCPPEALPLLRELNRPQPKALLIMPILVQGRSVAFLWGDHGDQLIVPQAASELSLFIGHVQTALTTFLKRRKSGLIQVTPSQIETSEPVSATPPPAPASTTPPVPPWEAREPLIYVAQDDFHDELTPTAPNYDEATVRREVTPDVLRASVAPESEPMDADATPSHTDSAEAEPELPLGAAPISADYNGESGSWPAFDVIPDGSIEQIQLPIPELAEDTPEDAQAPVTEQVQALFKEYLVDDQAAEPPPESPPQPQTGSVLVARLRPADNAPRLVDNPPQTADSWMAASFNSWDLPQPKNTDDIATHRPSSVSIEVAEPQLEELREITSATPSLAEEQPDTNDDDSVDISPSSWLRPPPDLASDIDRDKLAGHVDEADRTPVPLVQRAHQIDSARIIVAEEQDFHSGVDLHRTLDSDDLVDDDHANGDHANSDHAVNELAADETEEVARNVLATIDAPDTTDDIRETRHLRRQRSLATAQALEAIEASDAEQRERAFTQLASDGLEVLPDIAKMFPGQLILDPFQAVQEIPPFRRCGPVLRLLAQMGHPADPYIRPYLDHPEAKSRFYATYFYGGILVPEVIPRLIQRLHDGEPRICMLAARVLFNYRELPEFQKVVQHLHGRLDNGPLGSRRHAAYLMGLFRELSAVPKLIEVFAQNDRNMFDVAEDALSEITKQRFGPQPKKWLAWWDKNKTRPRIEWLIEGLASKHISIRRNAAEELAALTGLDMGFEAEGPRRGRDQSQKRWSEWWQTHRSHDSQRTGDLA